MEALKILQGQFEHAAKEFPGMMHVIAQAAKDGMHPIVPPAWKNNKPQRSKDGKYPIVPDGLASSDYCPRVWGEDIRREPDERGYPTYHWLRSSFNQKWDMQAALERFDTLAGETGEIVAKMDDTILPISKAKLWVKRPQEYWVLLLHHFRQKLRWTLVTSPGEILVPKLLHGLLGTITVNVRVKTLLGGTTETRLAQEGESYVCWFEDVFLASALALGELLSKNPQPNDGEIVEIDLQQFNEVPSKQLLRDLIDYPTGVKHNKDRHGKAQPKTLKERLRSKGYENVAEHIHTKNGRIFLKEIKLRAKNNTP